MTHDELILRCRRNDRIAQNLLFTTFERKVLGICMRYASSVDEAKDLQQEAFIKIFQSIGNNNNRIDSLERWVYRITVNTAIDHYRKRVKFTPIPLENATSSSVMPDVLDKLNEHELLALINDIPDPYRIVFNLYIIEGYSHKQASEQLGITESTSRSYLVRAKEFLHVSLAVHARKSKKNKVVWTI
jgi:RNA polymerase sigma factor (sigma-70 family)